MLSSAPALRLLRVLLFAVLALAVPRFAWAQTVTIPDNGYTRTNADGSRADDRNNIKLDVITYDDCSKDRGYDIVVNTTAYDQSSELQVWAGTQDCTPVAMRSGATQQCWRAFPGAVPRQLSSTINVKVRDILSYAKTQPDYVKAGDSVCATAAQANVTAFFIFVKGGESAGTPANKVFTVDTVGPPAPTEVKTGIGEKLLIVSWTPSKETTDTQSYNVYCDTAGDAGAPATTDAATGDGSTTDAATAASTGCGSALLAVGSIPPASLQSCGSGQGPASTSATIKEVSKGVALQNGVRYAVAVSAIDKYGNPGPLSDITCGTPAPTDDFFDVYKRSGGGADGCNTSGGGSVPVIAMFAAIALASLARRRRS
jgi:uncharacterized protein (TIGR03382 family)